MAAKVTRLGVRAAAGWLLSALLLLGCLVPFTRGERASAGGTPLLQPEDRPQQQREMGSLLEQPLAVPGGGGGEEGGKRLVLQPKTLLADGPELSSFPSVSNSTILFLHVFKCAGTTLREVLTTWAKLEGWSGAIVEYCRSKTFTNAGRICLNSKNDLMDPIREKWLVAGSKLLAGHFLWDFRHYVTPPYLMVTTLRNPLELFVSSQQFMHKAETKTLDDSVAFVGQSMRSRLGWADPTDLAFIRRFLDSKTANSYDPQVLYSDEEMSAMVQTAVDHLNTFYVVGVVEQYQGFIEVLKRTLDPDESHPKLWAAAVGVKDNGSRFTPETFLSGIDPDLVREFNATTLGRQWQVYDVALKLWDSRCREILPRKTTRPYVRCHPTDDG